MDKSQAAKRILVLGAHPDDAEFHAGGLLARHSQLGSQIVIVSVTDGRSGHHEISPADLVEIRREEARQAGRVIGANYVTWDFPDGRLEPTIAVREAIIRQVREFRPDLVLTHRANDYHPDHRAVGQAVQDACYLVTVPHIVPDVPALEADPVVASMVDLFTRPNKLRADIVLDISQEVDQLIQMAACHASQFFQWLPYHDHCLAEVPDGEDQRASWLKAWYLKIAARRLEHFADVPSVQQLQPSSSPVIEVYEISEYAGNLSREKADGLFPGAL